MIDDFLCADRVYDRFAHQKTSKYNEKKFTLRKEFLFIYLLFITTKALLFFLLTFCYMLRLNKKKTKITKIKSY